ncbi:uncharacterized protein LOC142975723 [Anticarsia gemmatalis]|uniref:uncharacterized protein LOC142975723 n=1 Tax=Anticarsia gemmatalis TaxID=129554 RepID=UPI003F76CF75
MSYNLIWIFLLILQAFVASLPIQDRYDLSVIGIDQNSRDVSPEIPKYDDTADSGNEKVISVRITSSVAVGRGKEKLPYKPPTHKYEPEVQHFLPKTTPAEIGPTVPSSRSEETVSELPSDLPPNLVGANIEYIKQIHAKKDSKDHTIEPVHPFQTMVNQHSNENEPLTKIDEYDEDIPTARKVPSTPDANLFHERKENRHYQHSDVNVPIEVYNRHSHINFTTDSFAEPSANYGLRMNSESNTNGANETIPMIDQQTNKKENRDINSFVSNVNNYHSDDSIAESSIKSVEFAKTTATVPPSYIQGLTNEPLNERQNNQRLTTVSFNIVHDGAKSSNNNEASTSYITTSQVVPNHQQQFQEPAKIYSEPARIYSEPSKFYSEPAKIYSEPAKIYSEPAKVYSEPAKIYSEPAKFYSEPASLHLNENIPNVPSVPPNYPPWRRRPQRPIAGTTMNTTPISTITNTYQLGSTQMEHQPERNYEVDEKVSVLTDGRSHGVQETSTEKCKQDNCKVGYVVEGRQYKKYRVEERTADGFIVGEYGVVRNEDGALRGVRYTADSDASPRLIHDALMKFLQLK